MLEYVHFLPGRLRLRITALRNRAMAAEAEIKVGAIPHVASAAANALTGSLTITFDPMRLSIADLWQTLTKMGYLSEGTRQPTVVGSWSSESADSDRFARAVAAAVVEAAVQHSAQLLFRALL